MCDDDLGNSIHLADLGLHREVAAACTVRHPLSRREVLRVGSTAAAIALLARGRTAPARAAGTRTGSAGGLLLPDGTTSTRHAMHVHTSGSEGNASVDAQATLAEANGCDVLWVTDHDWRVFALPDDTRLPREYVFTSLTSSGWTWKPVKLKRGTVQRAGVVSGDFGPVLDLAVAATGAATVGVAATTKGNQLEGFVVGRQVVVPLTVVSLSGQAWFEVVLQLSNHHGAAYSLVYRFGPTPDGSVRATATTGYVYRQVAQGDVTEVTLTPLDDIEALFGGDIVAADNSIKGITLQVTANRGAIEVTLPRLGLPRSVTGPDALDALVAVYDQVMASHPALTRRHGIEVSGTADHHLGWYGPGATNLPFRDPGLAAAVQAIHLASGVASYNHPFGTIPKPRLLSRIPQVLGQIAPTGVYGADIIELGYAERAGMTLDDHLLLGDLLWTRGVVITASGVTDDHGGVSWGSKFLTQLWGDGTEAADQLALQSGRATVSRIGYTGDLAVTLDGRPMGSVPSATVDAVGELTVYASDLPAGSTLEVLRGDVVPGAAVSGSAPIATTALVSDLDLVDGRVSVGVPGGHAYHRVVARDASGTIIAFTNPVWSGVPDPAKVSARRVVPM